MYKHQNRFGFNMKVGIFGTKIIEHNIFHNSLTSDQYSNLLPHSIEKYNLSLTSIRDCCCE